MRPSDVVRELNRLAMDAATARARLVDLRGRVSEARAIIEEVRGGSTPADRPAAVPPESTPEPHLVQGEATTA
ncbi:MAG: hypothetical protein HY698_08315 [Deltaproteobacteria bacterium]|nr:hypothetical protein [Deltaproteobacteria bacterium]